MKKLLFGLMSVIALLSSNVYAQDYLGFRQSNYSGINGVDLNPATLADNRFVVDVVLGGASFTGYNNHLYFNPKQMPTSIKTGPPKGACRKTCTRSPVSRPN